MRHINLIALHCSATPEGRVETVETITKMHKARGFATIGYHFLIGLNGERWTGRMLSSPGAHIAGHNANSIGICYVGGLDKGGKAKDTRTPAQKEALKALVTDLHKGFPKAAIKGHRDLSPDLDKDGKVERHEWLKDCPCFDVAGWLAEEGILS